MAGWIWRLIEQTFTRWNRNDGATLAAATAYYAAFSFFPLLMVLISGLGFALEFSESAQDAKKQLLELIAERTAPAFEQEVRSVIEQVQTRAVISGILAWAILLFGAIGIFSQIEFAFARLWHDTAPPAHGVRAAITNALWNRLKAFLTLIGLGILLIVSFVADLAFSTVQAWAEDNGASATHLWPSLQLAFTIGLNVIVLTLLYRLIPRARVRWLHAACGAVFFALVWQIGSQLLSRFIVGGNYSAYGVVGSFIAVMLWVYCASVLLYLGAQMVQVLSHPVEPGNGGPPPGAVA